MAAVSPRAPYQVPPAYSPPSFPSLYSPYNTPAGKAKYLYYSSDVWRFTLFWTLLVYGAVHLAASAYAMVMQKQKRRFVWVIPVIYLIVAGIEAVLAGSVVGLILGAVYKAGFLRMSTWIPFIWAIINVLVLILSSFSISGGL